MADPLRVLVVDTISLTAYGLSYLLDENQFIILPEQARSCTEARAHCGHYAPDILVLPRELANPYPEAVIGRFYQDFPNIRIILVDGNGDDIQWSHLVSLGIAGYLRRSDSPEIWQRCFRVLAEGGVYVGESAANRLPVNQAIADNHTPGQLAERDVKLLQLLAIGLNNEEIASELSLSKHTVKNSLTTLYKQLGVQTRSQAIAWGIQAGILEE
ncbi:MAG: response regulator transcription factor [Chloroflexi bacterium]|nr:response regulator transcription factor [Ardenticatenaceae bacterium]NOG34803.1 response regulator transcription factor [Chloroflexota bacterium]GIK55867.1 MAG: DNA-binding response regulator [Chloroflexota bacterium]